MEKALTFLFFFLLSFIVYFSFSNFIRFLSHYETHPFSLNTREMLSYPINFFIRDSFVLKEYFSYKKNSYLIK